MLKLSYYIKSGVGFLKLVLKLDLHRPIQDLGHHIAYHVLDPKDLSKLERWKEVVPNVLNRLQYMTS